MVESQRVVDRVDKIVISDLLLRCVIGINDSERREAQDVLIQITLYTDTSKPAKTDDIDDAVNYRSVTKDVIRAVEGSSFNLVETLAEEISNLCLKYDGVEGCMIRVEKPHALRFAGSVGVEIERWKRK